MEGVGECLGTLSVVCRVQGDFVAETRLTEEALRILYLAAGFLDWVDPARGEPLSSPLILVPVELRVLHGSSSTEVAPIRTGATRHGLKFSSI